MAATTRVKTKSSPSTTAGAKSMPVSLLVSLLFLLASTLGGIYAWRYGGVESRAVAAAALTVEKLEVTPQPAWIRADIRAEAFRDGSLGDLSVLDRELAYRVFRAFELHAWVEKVLRVSKEPLGRVLVELRYRRPVAWVEVPSIMSPDNQDGVLPIDAQAILLPPDDFREEDVKPYLRVSVDDLAPWGPVGTAWPDERVTGAAQIAALLDGQVPSLQLHRILVHATAAEVRSGRAAFYELVTRQGHRFLWGHAPGLEKSSEATSTSKVAHLRERAKRPDPLPNDRRLVIDLQTVTGSELAAETAAGTTIR